METRERLRLLCDNMRTWAKNHFTGYRVSNFMNVIVAGEMLAYPYIDASARERGTALDDPHTGTQLLTVIKHLRNYEASERQRQSYRRIIANRMLQDVLEAAEHGNVTLSYATWLGQRWDAIRRLPVYQICAIREEQLLDLMDIPWAITVIPDNTKPTS